ncbi:37892_t:CDS:2, partial [Gigaspora margarita]
KIKKECLKILSLKDDDIDLWPWNFGRELSSASIQNRVKNAISNGEFEEVDCDDPICSSIIDTAYPHPWLKSSFSETEWSELADVSKCGLNSDNFSQTISKNNMKEINNHLHVL